MGFRGRANSNHDPQLWGTKMRSPGRTTVSSSEVIPAGALARRGPGASDGLLTNDHGKKAKMPTPRRAIATPTLAEEMKVASRFRERSSRIAAATGAAARAHQSVFLA